MDALPGETPTASDNPKLAYTLLVDGVVKESGQAKLSEILELVQRTRADAIATDNIYELAPSIEKLQKVLAPLSHTPKVVQVTMIGDRTYPLLSLARSLGLSKEKPDPYRSSEIIAKLCYMGVGSELDLFEKNETRIIISKGRHPIQGGMSLERYKRNIENIILRKTKEIERMLHKKGFDYDIFLTRTKYGIERSVIVVYAPREKLFGLVKPLRTSDIQIKIELSKKEKPVFTPLVSKTVKLRRESDYLIVGIDPGIATGVAVLTLDGRLKLLTSGKELSRGQVIRLLSDYGNTIVIATDVSQPPAYVRKLASMLNAALVTPAHNLTVLEKRKLVEEYATKFNIKIRNSHQRDALAAAFYAYKSLAPKLSEAREKIRRLGLDIPVDEVEALVAKGSSIWDAIRAVTRKYYVPKFERKIEEKTQHPLTEGLPEELYEKLRVANKRIKELENEKTKLLSKINSLEIQLERILSIQNLTIKRDRTIEILNRRIHSLSSELDKLKNVINNFRKENELLKNMIAKIAMGEVVAIPFVENLDKCPKSAFNARFLVLGTMKPGDEERLVELGKKYNLRAILCERGYSDYAAKVLACHGIALIKCDDVKAEGRLEGVYLVRRDALEATTRRVLEELEDETKRFLREAISNLLKDYRLRRMRSYTSSTA